MDAERWWLVAGRRKRLFDWSDGIWRWEVERLTRRLGSGPLGCIGVEVGVMSKLNVEGAGL